MVRLRRGYPARGYRAPRRGVDPFIDERLGRQKPRPAPYRLPPPSQPLSPPDPHAPVGVPDLRPGRGPLPDAISRQVLGLFLPDVFEAAELARELWRREPAYPPEGMNPAPVGLCNGWQFVCGHPGGNYSRSAAYPCGLVDTQVVVSQNLLVKNWQQPSATSVTTLSEVYWDGKTRFLGDPLVTVNNQWRHDPSGGHGGGVNHRFLLFRPRLGALTGRLGQQPLPFPYPSILALRSVAMPEFPREPDPLAPPHPIATTVPSVGVAPEVTIRGPGTEPAVQPQPSAPPLEWVETPYPLPSPIPFPALPVVDPSQETRPVAIGFPAGGPPRDVRPIGRTVPARPARERKVLVKSGALRVVLGLVGAVTEGADLINDVYRALPPWLQRRGLSITAKLDAIVKHFREIDWNVAFYQMAVSQLEDGFYGRLGQASGRFSREAGLAYGAGLSPTGSRIQKASPHRAGLFSGLREQGPEYRKPRS